jgi:YegS/Rv2252/BmrU family lipid kinase
MARVKIILNPASGRGLGEKVAGQIEGKLRGYGLDYSLTRTERPWHAADLARQAVADGFEVVVAAGGDGTANEVLNGLMWAKRAGLGEATMAVICVGSGNDFAYGVNIPTGVEVGCEVLAQNHRRRIDVGLVSGGLYPEGRYFGNGIGIGFDAAVGFVAAKFKRFHGFLAYFVAALETIFLYYRAPLVRLDYNGQSETLSALMVSVMNGRRMGGGFMMAPEAQSNDGLFDLCIARQVSQLKILAMIPRFLQGTQASDPAIKTDRTQNLVVTALEGVLPAHADGETLCTEGRELKVELLPQVQEIICTPR